MPSPFPGMDPYLEKPERWPGFHQVLIVNLANAINACLPDQFVARVGERLYVVHERRSIYADVALIERPRFQPGSIEGGTAVAVATEEEDMPVIVDLDDATIHELFIEVRHVGNEGNVVTVVEVLSPTNKSAGDDREKYVKKQAAVLASPANLLEIDLLRRGRYTLAVPQGSLPTRTDWNYLISLHRSASRGRFEVWPVPLSRRLPRILVPLADGVPDVRVDLQAALTRTYDESRYKREIDYTVTPTRLSLPPTPPGPTPCCASAACAPDPHGVRP